jgi:Fic family protein
MKQNKPILGRPSSNALFAQFAKVTDTIKKYGGLPTLEQAADIWDNIWYVEAHNSTAIEGNTLVLSEVKALLQQKRSIGGKQVEEYMEVQGYANAAKWVYAQGKNPKMQQVKGDIISLTEIRFIHTELMRLVWEVAPHPDALPSELPGSFRRHDIMPFGDGMTPPPFTDVPARLSGWLGRVNSDVKNLDAKDIPLFLAKIHRDFESIHPFLDGNGRTGRLILNLILVRLGYPPVIILKSRRDSYIKALEIADRGNYISLAEIITKGVLDNVHRFISPKFASTTDQVNLQVLASKEISYEALRKAALRGRLEAQIGDDGLWYSTKESVNSYLNSRYKKQS